MVNENNLKPIIDSKKIVEEVRELEESSWWKEYQGSVVKSPLSKAARSKVINKSGSNYVSENKEGYGPMPFVDEANALIVARSQAIMSEMERDYPTVVRLLNYNRAGVIEFLKAEGGLSAVEVIHDFNVRSTSTSDYGPEVWRKYKDEIYVYVDELCKKLVDENGRPIYQEELKPARRTLGEHIYDEYYRKLPRWPNPFCENIEWIDVNVGGSYRSGSFYVVWNCSGYVKVHDKNEGFCAFRARFTGSPEIRVLLVNLDFLATMERRFRGNIEGGKRFIDSEQDGRRDRGIQYSWERRYLSM